MGECKDLTPKLAKDPKRYLSRHTWYLSDAQTLVRRLQAVAWPLGWHVALGGGVLTHGYSDHDLDLYVLPIYRDNDPSPNSDQVFYAFSEVFHENEGDEVVRSIELEPHECFERSWCYAYEGKPVEVFFIRKVA